MVLEQHRVVERDPLTARYRLGLRLFELGSAAIARFDIRARALPHLERLLHSTHETIHLCLLDEGEVIYLDKMEPARSVRMSSGIGRRNPVHCTAVGKAILAWLPAAEVELIVHQHGLQRFTRHTITTLAELHAELQKVRAQGYAVDDEENEEGVRCVGAAVMDHLGYPAAAVSVSAPSFRLPPEKVALVGAEVVAAVREISAEWGYRSDRFRKGVS
jgi:DNA-binding IclR family transcriptional regulator